MYRKCLQNTFTFTSAVWILLSLKSAVFWYSHFLTVVCFIYKDLSYLCYVTVLPVGPVSEKAGCISSGQSRGHTPWCFSIYTPPTGALVLSGAVPLPGLCTSHRVLTAAVLYWCKSRARPAVWLLGGCMFPLELCLGSCVRRGGCKA